MVPFYSYTFMAPCGSLSHSSGNTVFRFWEVESESQIPIFLPQSVLEKLLYDLGLEIWLVNPSYKYPHISEIHWPDELYLDTRCNLLWWNQWTNCRWYHIPTPSIVIEPSLNTSMDVPVQCYGIQDIQSHFMLSPNVLWHHHT